jgi:hypothetical protein
MSDGRVVLITKAPRDWVALGVHVTFVDSDSSSLEEVDAEIPAGSLVRFSVRRKRRRADTDDALVTAMENSIGFRYMRLVGYNIL